MTCGSSQVSEAMARLNSPLARLSQEEFKNGAGTASSPRLVSGPAVYGDEPSPPAVPTPARSLSLTHAAFPARACPTALRDGKDRLDARSGARAGVLF